jgi:hypothetical protein
MHQKGREREVYVRLGDKRGVRNFTAQHVKQLFQVLPAVVEGWLHIGYVDNTWQKWLREGVGMSDDEIVSCMMEVIRSQARLNHSLFQVTKRALIVLVLVRVWM